jgi:DNA-binding Xre family transcriptional regulator
MYLYGYLDEFYNEVRNDFDCKLENLLLEVNKKILGKMKERKIRKNALARALGVHPACVTDYFNRRSGMRLDTLARICVVLGCDVKIDLVDS